MNTDMNRRGFLKLASALGVAAAVPIHIINEAEAAVEIVEAVAPSSNGLHMFDGNRWVRVGDIVSVQIERGIQELYTTLHGYREYRSIHEKFVSFELISDSKSLKELNYDFYRLEKVKLKSVCNGFEILFEAYLKALGTDINPVGIVIIHLDTSVIGDVEISEAV